MKAPLSTGRVTAGILCILGGVAGFTLFLVMSLVSFFGAMQPVETPGTSPLTLQRGEYTIYWETESRFHRPPNFGPQFQIEVVSTEDGTALTVDRSILMTSHYSTGSRSGISIAGFSVAAKGLYEVRVHAASDQGRVVVSKSMGVLGVLKLVAICAVFLAGGLGAGIFLLVSRGASPGRKA